jgi:hypothetical protein
MWEPRALDVLGQLAEHLPAAARAALEAMERTAGQGQGAECFLAGQASQPYDPVSAIGTCRPVTIAAYAERLVEAGKPQSESAVVNDALVKIVERDRRSARRWK